MHYGNMLYGFDTTINGDIPDNLIREIFSKELLKELYYHALRVDIPDNNDKAEIIARMLKPEGFQELGTGTNRIAFRKNGLVFKVALDRRGFTDNYTEFKRSSELDMYLAKTYETNMLINVGEYVNVLDMTAFNSSKEMIIEILADISKAYIFNDIGFTSDNYCNWGYRDNGNPDDRTLVILDYGYLYPLAGQDIKTLFKCPKCGCELKWNPNYTSFVCSGKGGLSSRGSCNASYSPTTIIHSMNMNFENMENRMISKFNSLTLPNFNTMEKIKLK